MHINGIRQSDNTFGGELCRRWCAESVFECAGSRAENKTHHKRKGHTPHTRGETLGQKNPMLSPLKTKNLYFFLFRFFDLPCKRTCHGKGRMTKIGQGLSSSTEPFVPTSLTSVQTQIHPKIPRLSPSKSSYYSYSFRLTNIHEFALFNRKEKSDLQMLKRCRSNWSRKHQGFEPPSV